MRCDNIASLLKESNTNIGRARKRNLPALKPQQTLALIDETTNVK